MIRPVLIEITMFRLADGAGEEDFLAADKAVQEEFFHHQSGFVRRTTARTDQDWAVITLWGSAEHADAAARAAAGDPTWADFRGLVDGASLDVRRYETLD